MTFQRFLLLLAIVSIAVMLTNLILPNWIPSLQNHDMITWWSLSFFIITSIFMFRMGERAILSNNKFEFSRITIAFVIFKMLVSIAIILFYKKTFQPSGKAFILPFFIAYFSFTIFETYFMLEFTKNKKAQ